MIKKFLLLTLLSFSYSQRTYAQRVNFYTSLKVPLLDYVVYLVNDNNDPNTTTSQGVIFDTGVSVKVHRSFFLESGIEYFVINYYKKKQPVTTSSPYNELVVTNSAFAFQGKPVFSIPLNKNTRLRLGLGLNYQKLISKANLYSYQNNNTPSSTVKTENSQTKFRGNMQPLTGIQFKMSSKIAMGFDLNYIKVNWNESMKDLTFFNAVGGRSSHKTSSVFLSARIVY